MDELRSLRESIDQIDRELAALFAARMAVTARIGRYKLEHGLPVLDRDRERQVLESKAALLEDPALVPAVKTLFQTIMALSRQQQQALIRDAAPAPRPAAGNLYLIGMMGAGKSTCAALLAPRLGLPLMDTDQEIQARAGMTVSEIFARQGEAAFRDMETELLRTLAGRRAVVACGGGLPLRPENRRLLRESGVVVLLDRDPAAIYDSLDTGGRPLGQQGRDAFLRLAARRRTAYLTAAHVVVGDLPTPGDTAEAILRAIQNSFQSKEAHP